MFHIGSAVGTIGSPTEGEERGMRGGAGGRDMSEGGGARGGLS